MQKRLQVDTKTDARRMLRVTAVWQLSAQSRDDPHPFQQPLAWRLLHLAS